MAYTVRTSMQRESDCQDWPKNAGKNAGVWNNAANGQVTPSTIPSGSELSEAIDHIAQGSEFRHSEKLRDFLQYLAKCAVETPTRSVSVKDIATHVFGRSQDFDPQLDSLVRVHTARLRSRLAEYYANEGSRDRIVVTVPKGGYSLSIAYRQADPSSSVDHALHLTPDPNHGTDVPLQSVAPTGAASMSLARLSWLIVFVLSLIVVAGIAYDLGNRARNPQVNISPAIDRFWRPFATGDAPLVVFSNFQLAGSFKDGLKDAEDQKLERTPVIDTYTTMGEVMGVYEISRVMEAFHQSIRPKRGALLTWDDAQDGNLIFVGGPLAWTPLRETPIFHDFEFRNWMDGIPGPSGAIVNLRPGPGEDPIYYGPTARPYQFDYALIALRPSINPAHRMLVLAGVTEFGTEAASEFVTHEGYLNDLITKLHVQRGAPIPPFEALIRATITGGVPTQMQLVLVHQFK